MRCGAQRAHANSNCIYKKVGETVKIAFTTNGTDLDAVLNNNFGRAPQFLIVDTENNRCEIIDNTKNIDASQGAGIQSAENIIQFGAQTLICAHCGPKAFRVLAAAEIDVYYSSAKTVTEALQAFNAGELSKALSADVPAHN